MKVVVLRDWSKALLACVPGSTFGSKWRRVFSYWVEGLTICLLFELWLANSDDPIISQRIFGLFFVATSIVFFAVVVVGVIFLTSERFRPNPIRLALDGALSIFFSILSFAVFYRTVGLKIDGNCQETYSAEAVYFSAVTFSTLGYGDISPCAPQRLVAASQAIRGNLHLGLIVGIAFFFADRAWGSNKG